MTVYNKLVRDKIPDILDEEELDYKVRIMEEEEFGEELKNKLKEEVEEFFKAEEDNQNSIMELADIIEVIYSLINFQGIETKKLHRIRLQKRIAKGGFRDKIFLEYVKEKKSGG